MKSLTRNLSFLIAVFTLFALITGCKTESPAFQVNDVVSDPGAFNGSLTIVGIVNAHSQADETIVGIMDKKELQCSSPGCEKVLLPVKITGKRPSIGDEIRVYGTFNLQPQAQIFVATKVEVMAKHKLGGQG